ncbi:MAG: thioredoxin domain-containing protein [Thermoleophilia bacterium]|nr:thioredoxin domain-containing protein [Thermoleophilia bacterium]
MPNRLAYETSPYLLQHAHNPVDWYPWGEEALARARAENRPIFLSVGYAACHWCHVMERESFEDEDTAALLNQAFVSIKVDREERPDLDAIYMQAVVAMTGRGGWPMSVWLTPQAVPFFGGTYFPDRPRQRLPSFRQVLEAVAEAWRNHSQEITASADDTLARLAPVRIPAAPAETALDPEKAAEAVRRAATTFDWTNGGWGEAPKFPQPMPVESLLRHHVRTGEPTSIRMVHATLRAMALSGLCDQLGGGFHRYATDAVWLVPHFEKMLYDNAQLARVYLHAWQLTGEPLYRRTAVETLDYVAGEMTHPQGGFFSSQDADSEGEEGRYFVWTPAQVEAVLGRDSDLSHLAVAAFGITEQGNFEGSTVLHLPSDWVEVLDGWPAEIREVRTHLLAAREERVKPARDEKVLTAWNGLMLAAFAEAALALDRADYRETAERNADFVLRELRTAEGRLLRSWKDGSARIAAYLQDYTHLADGLLALYQLSFEDRWFEAARDLLDVVLTHFPAPEGGFFDTPDDHEALITRPRDLQDNAVPSGNAMAAQVLLRLAALTGQSRYSDAAEGALAGMAGMAAQHPVGFGQWLAVLELVLGPRIEVAVVGEGEDPGTRALLQAAREGFRPFQVTAFRNRGSGSPVPLLAGRKPSSGAPAAWVCTDGRCLAPVTTADALRQALLAPATEFVSE